LNKTESNVNEAGNYISSLQTNERKIQRKGGEILLTPIGKEEGRDINTTRTIDPEYEGNTKSNEG